MKKLKLDIKCRTFLFFLKSSKVISEQYTHYAPLFKLHVEMYLQNFACLYPIKVKTAEQLGPKFVVGLHVTPGKIYG